MADANDKRKEIEAQINKLSGDTAKRYRELLNILVENNAALFEFDELLIDVNNRTEALSEGFGSIESQLNGIVNELKNVNSSSKDITQVFSNLRSVAQKLKYDQQGITDLNKDQLKKEKSKIKILQDQLKILAKQAQEKKIAGEALTEQEAAAAAAYDAQKDQFSIIEDINALLDERIKQEKKLERRLGATGAILAGMGKIPIVGPLLKTNEALDAAREKAKAGGNSFQVMGAAAKSIGSNLLSSLADPLVSIGLLVKAFQMLLELGFKLDKQVVGLQKAFYSSRVEAELLQERFQENVDTNNVLVKGLNSALLSRENQTEAAIQLSNAMGAVGRLTDQEIQSQIKLTKQMGLSVEEGQALYVLGKQNKMTSSEVVDEITKQVKANQKQTGVLLDTKKITQDVSKINGQLRLQYGNNVKQLTAAVIQSNKLGFSLEKSKQIAEQLLNFEESIENELSAELLIGRDLNLEQARLLALNGKSAEATALIAEQMGGSAGFAAMNVIQQESLAKALGMSADELANSLLHQENLSNLKNSDKKLLENEIARLKERGELEKAQQLERAAANGANIQSAIEAISKQDEFNENVKKIREIIEGIVSGPAFMLAEWITDMIKSSKTLQIALTGVAAVVGGALLVSLTKAIISMGALVAETIAYVIAWTVANPIAAAAGAVAAIGIGALIASEVSSAREKEREKAKTNFATGGVVMSRIDNATIGERGPEAIIPLSSPSAKQMMGGGGPTQLTANLILDGQVLATMVAQVDRTDPNRVGTERQINNRNIQ
jgi:hypothetical protein